MVREIVQINLVSQMLVDIPLHRLSLKELSKQLFLQLFTLDLQAVIVHGVDESIKWF